jgi:NADPH:quinone reductase-like Zn-dependent oxidoreductase
MRAVRLHRPGIDGLSADEIEVPPVGPGEALVRVHAAAITRDELNWPVGRLPAIPSYELSGAVVAVAPDVRDVAEGDDVFALTPFDRDGVAAECAVVPAVLAPKPRHLTHVESAAITLAGLSAWQGLFDHGALRAGERVPCSARAGE